LQDLSQKSGISQWHSETAYLIERKQKNKQTPWFESASELYRPSDRRLKEKAYLIERKQHILLKEYASLVLKTAEYYFDSNRITNATNIMVVISAIMSNLKGSDDGV
jgi:hypothetical protein